MRDKDHNLNARTHDISIIYECGYKYKNKYAKGF